ncbi:MAG: hypothetical protein L0Y66_01905, partial [Myxococcaceae bacterium]|nr:hypothetical protein [Myxococcaceae bacterium]
ILAVTLCLIVGNVAISAAAREGGEATANPTPVNEPTVLDWVLGLFGGSDSEVVPEDLENNRNQTNSASDDTITGDTSRGGG